MLGRAPGRANAPDIGFLPEERGLYRQMTALDTITYFGRLKGMTAARREARRAPALLDRFGLAANITLDRRQAVEGHGAEGPARHRARQPAAPADPRRAVLRARSGQPGAARGRDPARFGGGLDGRLLHPRDAACRAPVRPAAAARARAARNSKARSTRRAPSFRRGCRSSPSRTRPTLAGVESADGPRRGRGRLAPLGRAPRSPASRPATCSNAASPSNSRCGASNSVHASLHDVFVHIVGAAEARPMNNILIVAGARVPPDRRHAQLLADSADHPAVACRSAPLAPRFIDNDEPDRVMVIDRTGGGEARGDRSSASTLDHDRDVLTELSRYVQRHHLEQRRPGGARGRSTTAGTATPTSPRSRRSGGLAAPRRRRSRA